MNWTANRVIAYNLKRLREAANLTQQHAADITAPYLPGGGWSRAVWSAAERGVERDRIRHFDGDEIVGLALGLGVPVMALFLPPLPEDGQPDFIVGDGADKGPTPRRLLEIAALGDPATRDRIGQLASALGVEVSVLPGSLDDARTRHRFRRLLDHFESVAAARDEVYAIYRQMEEEK
jgi:hypothetical protein